MTDSHDSAPRDDSAAETARLDSLVAMLTLDEKVQLLTGRDFWTTWPIERIGLRRILVSDGPSGVRGEVWDERSPSLNLPSATALSSSWDTGMAARYGAAAAVEARRKGVDAVLGPTINLHRSPLNGRHFEAFSEDPLLTAELAAAYVEGVQANGVGATPKHYIANDYETERFTANTVVSERALRELYLLAFEKSVTEARAWLVMSSYNRINGTTATESDLLETPLNSEWGFDGVVISDWTAVRTVDSARASQDLVMPGPDGPWGDALVAAVRAGEIAESTIDRKIVRILRLAARVGALEGFAPVAAAPVTVEDGVAFTREAEAAGSVLLANPEGTLPLDSAALTSVALIGHNGLHARTQGGGSATVLPSKVVSPLDGLRAALPDAEVTYSIGAVVQEGIAELPLDEIVNPATGEHGMLVRFLDADGAELFREDRFATALTYFGGDAPIDTSATCELSLTWTPTTTGEVLLGFASVGHGRILVDGTLVHEETSKDTGGMDLGASLLSPPSIATPIRVTAGTPLDIGIEFDMTTRDSSMAGVWAITAGLEADDSDPERLIADAVAAASAADVAIVVVGTNSRVESEGFDRTDLDLPGRQDDLVRAVVAANPNTVVVVNSGSPVVMPWRDDVRALLLTYFGGQEYGNALADLLLGRAEPGGRLPTTWPARMADVPVLDVTPHDGIVAYDEGIHIGYRAWLRSDRTPAFEFGHGLGYTTWALDSLEVSPTVSTAASATVSVHLTNTGDRAGKQVVQVYVSRDETAVDRPVRWLVGFAPIELDAGESGTVDVALPARALADWNDGWNYEPGRFRVHVGTSLTDTPLEGEVELQGASALG
jgi:beta-glucosidase